MCNFKTLEAYYCEILSCEKNRYYQDQKWNISLSEALSKNNSRKFIRSIINAGNKSTDEIMRMLRTLNPERCSHIVSTYLLGLTLYTNNDYIQEYINKQLDLMPTLDNCLHKRFLYVWFLICFFHDLGYAYENNKISGIKVNHPTIDKRYSKKSLLPAVYTTELVRNYQTYRIQCMHKYDHGIYGGMKIYEEIKNQTNPRKEIVAVLKVISQIIMVHNIFSCPEDKKQSVADCYRCHHLDVLLYHSERPSRLISLEKNSLLFLFDLVDSIEPLKEHHLSILSKIQMRIQSTQIDIKTNDEKYINRIKNIHSWLTDVKELSTDEYRIILSDENEKHEIRDNQPKDSKQNMPDCVKPNDIFIGINDLLQ